MHHDTEIEHQEVRTDEGTVAYEVVECAGDCGERHALSEMVEVAIGEYVCETPEIDGDWVANVAMATPTRFESEVPPVVPLCADCALDLGYVGPTGLDGTAPEPTATRQLRMLGQRRQRRNYKEEVYRGLAMLAVGLWIGFWVGVNVVMFL